MNPPDTSAALDAASVAGIFAGITAGLANGRQLETLLGQFLVPVVRLAGAQAGAVRTLADDDQTMQLIGGVGLPAGVLLAERSVDRHCGICGIAADSNALAWADDLQTCALRNSREPYFGLLCKRVLAVPLRHGDRLLGVYNLFFDTDTEPRPEIVAVFRSIGDLMGLALHNARLEDENLRASVMNERKLLANEVHDTIAQTLVYMNMRMPLLHDAMLQHDDQLSLKYFSDVRQAVGEVHASLREILTNYRACMDSQGLLQALRSIADSFQNRTAIALEFSAAVSDLALSVEQEVQIFRIVQQALTNVARHSQARRAWLTIQQSADQLEILVEDDGKGFTLKPGPALTRENHFGLMIMQERTQRLGGSLEVVQREGGGTRVRLAIPAAAVSAWGPAS